MQPSLKSLLAIAAVAVAASAGTGGSAVAQTAEAMRTLNASPMDIADGKHLAEIGCAACHNLDGISTVKGTPHIAGQRPAYLYLTLKEYKSGVRSSEAMTSAIKFLSDDALMKVAAYFASLDPAPPPGGPAGPAVPDPEEAGKTASAACAGCHGNSRRQPDSRHPEPDRARSEIPGRRDEGLQRRPAQERHHEGDAGGGERYGDE